MYYTRGNFDRISFDSFEDEIESAVLFIRRMNSGTINGRRDARRREITIDRTEHENSRVERERGKRKRKERKRDRCTYPL